MFLNRLSLFLLFLSILFSSCGGSEQSTREGSENSLNVAPLGFSELHRQVKNLGSDFPADLDIGEGAALKDTLFVTLSSPAAVIALNLNTANLEASSTFTGLRALPGGVSIGFPVALTIQNDSHAYLLTNNKIVGFNPRNGNFLFEPIDVLSPISPSSPLKQIDSSTRVLDPISASFSPSFPQDILVVGNKLLVSFSNLFEFVGSNPRRAVQGVVKVFEITETGLNYVSYFTSQCGGTELHGFNATGLTKINDHQALVTCSGLNRINMNGLSEPVSPGGVDLLNVDTLTILSNLSLGYSAPSFRAWALNEAQNQAYLGSSSGGYALQIAIGASSLSVLRGEDNPIVISSNRNGTDFLQSTLFIPGSQKLLVASYNRSRVSVLNTFPRIDLLSPELDLSIPGVGGVTGAGPMVRRIGRPGIDYSGPDVFIATASPGTLTSLKTY